MLHGRERECATITRLLDGARDRRSGVLVVRGEAGIGKSALLDYAAGQAAGLRVLRGGGVESEAELPYAAAHQLLRPVADRLSAIPQGQAAALRAAFGLGDPVEGDRFLVSVAVLSLLSEVAEERPLLCLIDDVQWLDGASADAFGFVARRLEAEGIVLLLAARDEHPAPPSPTTPPPTALGTPGLTRRGSLGPGGPEPRGLSGPGPGGLGSRGLSGPGPGGSGSRGLSGPGAPGSGSGGLDGSGPESRGLAGSGAVGSGEAGLGETAGAGAPGVAGSGAPGFAGVGAVGAVPGGIGGIGGWRAGGSWRMPGPGAPRPFAALPELRLRGLEPEAARALLAERTPEPLAPEVADLLVAGTAGNPLGLLELPASLSADQLAGARPLPERLPIGEVLEQVFLTRVRGLTAPAQTLLLIAAAEESGDVGLVLRAAHLLDLPPDALDEGEYTGLVRVDGATLTFRHPLVRSAVYRGATFLQRRAVEQALAAALSDEDADRRAWHLAAAATGPDESVAMELETSAGRAARRGGHAAAASALRRAADLTAAAAARGRRLTLAAEAGWLAGQPERARALADEAARYTEDPRLLARGDYVRGAIEGLCGRPDLAYALLVTGSEQVAALDPAQAARMLTEAGRLAWTAADLPKLAAAGRRLTGLSGLQEGDAGARLLVGLAALLEGDAERAAPPLRAGRALAMDSADPHSLTLAAAAALFLGEDTTALDLLTSAAVRARAAGTVSALPLVLAPLGALQMWTGRFAAGHATATEGLKLSLDTRQDNSAAHHRAVLAWIAAAQGRAEECGTEADAALGHAIGQRLGPPAAIAAWALALLDLGEGRMAEACDRLTALADAAPGEGHPIVKIFAAADLVEAAVRTERKERATEALDLLRSWAGPARAPWAHALVARCQGLVEGTDEPFARALTLHARAGRPFDTARTALLFGEALRRRRRRAEARRHLRTARETFERLGARPWAELARVELQATGETARKRDPGTIAGLTPQELQIARLVSEGGTNREIAAHLFLSPRTVDYHLHKIFVKLGISSRAELVRLTLEDPALLGGTGS